MLVGWCKSAALRGWPNWRGGSFEIGAMLVPDLVSTHGLPTLVRQVLTKILGQFYKFLPCFP